MREVDVIRVRDLLGNISDALRRLRELGQFSEDEFVSDYRNTESAKYLLLVASAAAINICNHIVARRGGRAPQDYADCFDILAELSVITPDLSARLRRMARFRNLIVHQYWHVDNHRVYQIVQEDLGDLDAFRGQVLAWLVP